MPPRRVITPPHLLEDLADPPHSLSYALLVLDECESDVTLPGRAETDSRAHRNFAFLQEMHCEIQ